MWALVVGLTGVINTLGRSRSRSLAVRPARRDGGAYRDRGGPGEARLDSGRRGRSRARSRAGHDAAASSPFPANGLQQQAATTRSSCAATRRSPSRLLKPALIDAETGKLTDSRDCRGTSRALFMSQPLHFGDYGGMPLEDPLGAARRPHDRRARQRALSLAAQAQGRRQRRSRHRARLRGQCPSHVVVMVCREKPSNAWTDFCRADRRRRVEHRRPSCGAYRRWVVGCLIVAHADGTGSVVCLLPRATKARSAKLD